MITSRTARAGVTLAALLLLSSCEKSKPGPSFSERPKGPLSLDEARKYMVDLVNRDRAEAGLEAVEIDEVATKAAQRHAEDMAAHGYTAHWGTDGSVPEQRYTEAGGVHMVQENAACFFDGVPRPLDPDAKFDPAELEKLERAFMSEVAPNDGHKLNIIKPVHNRLGVGLAQPLNINQPCLAQEFVDHYGEYGSLPAEARRGQNVTVQGEVLEPVQFGGVGIARIEPAAPLSPEHLNSTSVYRIPAPKVLYFPKGFKTPKPVEVDGRSFKIEVPLELQGKTGRYQISIWGKYPEADALVMVSLRTITVR